MTRRTIRGVVFLALALLVLGVACAPAAPPPTPTAAAPAPKAAATPTPPPAPTPTPKPVTVKYGTSPRVVWYWSDYVAEDKGFYKEEGITREEIIFQNTAELTAAILGGSVNTGALGVPTLVTANQKGADLVMLMSYLQQPVFSLVTRPEIKSYEQLKGKKIAVFSLKGSGSTVLLVRLLASKGLKPADYDMIAVGGTPQRYAGLKSGAVDAALLLQPQDFQIVDEGFHLLGFTSEATKMYALGSVTVSKKWAAGNQDTVVRLLRGRLKATRWLYDPKNKDEAIKNLSAAIKVEPKYATKAYELYIEQLKAFPPDGAHNLEGVQAAIDIGLESGEFQLPIPKATDLIDSSFLEAARKGL